ncbi:MAG: hypothetical protein QW059_01000 [Nitrososphaerota archaeon]
MSSLKILLALITIAWASLIGILTAITILILPLTQVIESSLAASLARLGFSLILFAVWVFWLFELALYISIKLSRGRGGKR